MTTNQTPASPGIPEAMDENYMFDQWVIRRFGNGPTIDIPKVALQTAREAWLTRANLPLPRGEADKVDALVDMLRSVKADIVAVCEKERGLTSLVPTLHEINAAIDAARLTPGGQQE